MTFPSLKQLNTFNIESSCRELVEFTTVESLQKWLADRKPAPVELLILGGGSNLLFVEHIDKTVIRANISGINYTNNHDRTVSVRVGGGVNWHDLVLDSLNKGYSSLENLSLIPGNVGAAPIQNIGAYGVELKDFFVQLKAIDLLSNELVILNKADCQFGYRDSIFKRESKGRYLIVEIELLLSTEFQPVLKYGPLKQLVGVEGLSASMVSDEVIRIRSSKLPDPKVLGNSGSFFKNPTITHKKFAQLKALHDEVVGYETAHGMKIAAGWLIDQAGLKGYRVGDAGVHQEQALVLVNHGNATGREIFALAQYVQQTVFEKFAVTLEPEVWILPPRQMSPHD